MSLLENQIQHNAMGASASRPMNLGANFGEANENIRRPKECQNCKLYPNVAVCGTIREQVGPNKAEGFVHIYTVSNDLFRSTEELDECLENGHFPFSESPSQTLVV
ncbi:hypothetical protein GQ457_18G000310 [Hibiscus cannabinus]